MLDASQISQRIKLRQLNVLIAVVEAGSMAKAAEHLAISQPVISKMIASLEQTLGFPLLERSRLGVEPTAYGKALLKRSIALRNDLRSGVDELQSLADPAVGELRIGSTEPVMAGLLPAIIDRLSRQYPRLALHIIEGEPPELQDRHLRNHDIGLMIGRLPSPTPAADTMSKCCCTKAVSLSQACTVRGCGGARSASTSWSTSVGACRRAKAFRAAGLPTHFTPPGWRCHVPA